MRPAVVVGLHGGQQLVDVFLLEAARVAGLVDEARGRRDEHHFGEALRLAHGGNYPNHGCYGVADEHDIVQGQGAHHGQQVVGVAGQFAVSGIGAVGAEVGFAGPNQVEEYDLVLVFKGGGNKAPVALVAAKAVQENDGSGIGTGYARDSNVAAFQN